MIGRGEQKKTISFRPLLLETAAQCVSFVDGSAENEGDG